MHSKWRTGQSFKEVHAKDSGEHQGSPRLFKQIVHLDYYWPMEADVISFARKCQACQLHRNGIHPPAVELCGLSIPLAIHTWAFDHIGPFNRPSRCHILILDTTEWFTKWAEAIVLKWASGDVVANFIQDNVICWFGISKCIHSDNGTPFVNSYVRQLCEECGLDHTKASTYYTQENCQAETTNKTLSSK